MTYPHVPYVPTPEHVARKMLELAGAGANDIVYDLGAGDGRIVIIAAREFNVKKAIGIEIRSDLVREAKRKIKELNLEDRVEIKQEDMFKAKIGDATIVTLFLLTSVNEKLKPKLELELKPGTRVVSHEFQMPGWKPKVVATIHDGRVSHTIYLYVIGEHK
ncbi:MAG TPA: class I SAM-dependent methyltransferase [Desulfurococcaceae archaeon]|nr:class I SAM-dependent methyltransferase [Desulfurococcaceae archaeon]